MAGIFDTIGDWLGLNKGKATIEAAGQNKKLINQLGKPAGPSFPAFRTRLATISTTGSPALTSMPTRWASMARTLQQERGSRSPPAPAISSDWIRASRR